jgi:hypothetical protein
MLFGDECQPEPTCSEPYHWVLTCFALRYIAGEGLPCNVQVRSISLQVVSRSRAGHTVGNLVSRGDRRNENVAQILMSTG